VSVYTELTRKDMQEILARYSLGELISFEGIAAGIENSNYFIDMQSDSADTRYVLTVFERMNASELPYFMELMHFLSKQGVSCPDVMRQQDGALLFEFSDGAVTKVGCVVSCLSGKTLDQLSLTQLTTSGEAMARLHVAGMAFEQRRCSPTGLRWLETTIETIQNKVLHVYGDDAATLLMDALDEQRCWKAPVLPKGVIHGDLFVDNILFERDAVSGMIDFYYAHDESLVLDVAIALNAQAVIFSENDPDRMRAFIAGYESVRLLNEDEKNALPHLLCLAALRFWVSRLYDALFPRGGSLTQTKDPEEYRNKLLFCQKVQIY